MSQIEQFKQQFQTSMSMFDTTIEHVPSDKADWHPEGSGRSFKGVLDHLVASNAGFSKVIGGEPLPQKIDRSNRKDVAIPSASWDEAVANFHRSGEAILKAMDGLTDAQLGEERELPWGDTANAGFAMAIVNMHMVYHLGQANYLQTLWGDHEDRL